MEHADAIQKAVDDYLLMERKARALDRLREGLVASELHFWVDEIDEALGGRLDQVGLGRAPQDQAP